MTTVLIVCGAGASSTFLASRMRALAKTRGLDFDIQAASDADVSARLPLADILLVGPHLAKTFDDLRSAATARSVEAELLPENVFGPTGAEHALDRVVALLAAREPGTNQTEGASRG